MTSSTPSQARGHARDLSGCIQCTGRTKHGERCRLLVRRELGSVCGNHIDHALPRELSVLRDPRTGEPLEVV